MRARDAVRRWFAGNEYSGMILPDGWYGRPYDNLHMLTSSDEDDCALELVLDARLFLRFEGVRGVSDHGQSLVIGPFDHLVFEEKATLPLKREYTAGHVEFVAL